ncbi:hypothetical protein [Aerosakkonema funiforme]|uniref:Uncharacterized protein n=1 Tax=Aerosakkonema funiforme FACHB-1375 TaxID=2949571 RepID=A0A926ZIS3_9CYAN|nr:hypothetical protein [Aerosakkonema funiforme]MBD2184355.1 hypothetical protein [Aerosakkonema funiforme FACHB-1375]
MSARIPILLGYHTNLKSQENLAKIFVSGGLFWQCSIAIYSLGRLG